MEHQDEAPRPEPELGKPIDMVLEDENPVAHDGNQAEPMAIVGADNGAANGTAGKQPPHEIDLEERRRLECLDNMEKIEKEFTDLKEKFYAEKIDNLKQEMDKVSEGTHDKLLQKIEELKKRREDKIWAAEQWREYQLQNIANTFEGELKQADDELDSEKGLLVEKMIGALQDKQRKLEEEKNNLNLTDGDMRAAPNPRNLRSKRGKESNSLQNHRKKLNPPHINYTLKESEIGDDLNSIAKSITRGGKASEIFIDHGVLTFQEKNYEKGSAATIEWDNTSITGLIFSVHPSEIQLKSSDGTKHRYTLQQLRSGKYTITSA